MRRHTYLFNVTRTADKVHELKSHRNLDLEVTVKARSIHEARRKAYELAEITDRGEYGFDIGDTLIDIVE